jgi:hypothetical protein
MRPTRIITTLATLVFLGLGASLSGSAFADNEFDVNVAAGQIIVTAHTGWHINKDYPWKLVVGEAKLDKTKFSLAETTATLSGAPKGSGTLKGAVCSADQCRTFQKDVTIQ